MSRRLRRAMNAVFFGAYVLSRPRLVVAFARGLYLPVHVQFEWLRRFEFRTVIDVGASRGDVSRSMLYLCPGSTVYGFEPNPSVYQELVRRVRSSSFVPVPSALGGTAGSQQLYATEYAPASSLLPVSEIGAAEMTGTANAEPIDVECMTLDDYFRDRPLQGPVLLKIDVQGTELLVLEGGSTTLKSVDVIHVETSFKMLYEGQALFDDVYKWLLTAGFQYAGSTHEAEFYPSFGLSSQENSVFIRRGVQG